MDYSASKIMPTIEPLRLPPAELAALHVRYARRKTKRVLDTLFRAHAPLAISLARKFSVHSNHAADLQMAAFAGLLQALSRYDPKIGKFSTFAYWWILKFILKQREFDQNLVRIPLTLVRRHRKVRQLIEAGYSLPQAAKKLGLSLVAVETLYGLYDVPHCVVLDHTTYSDSRFDSPYADATSERVATLQAQLKNLPPKLRTAVTLRYRNSGDRSFSEIGRRMNCCAESARRYYLAGLKKLKHLIKNAEGVD